MLLEFWIILVLFHNGCSALYRTLLLGSVGNWSTVETLHDFAEVHS